MNESAVYTEADLKSFRSRLDELREIVRNDKESGLHPPAMTKLLDRKLNECGMSAAPISFSSTVINPNGTRNLTQAARKLTKLLFTVFRRDVIRSAGFIICVVSRTSPYPLATCDAASPASCPRCQA